MSQKSPEQEKASGKSRQYVNRRHGTKLLFQRSNHLYAPFGMKSMVSEPVHELASYDWRCVSCGERIDPVILVHRRQA